MPATPRAICVYCASSSKVDGVYHDAAAEVGRLIARRAGTLVFGGNCIGLMNVVAEAVHAHGGRVVGITPRLMHEKGITYEAADELIVTDDMRQRKAEMERRSDAFLTMPGGFGTLEELFETLTHWQLGYHAKPIVLLNTAGFYDPLIELFEHIYEHRFARTAHRDSYHVAATPSEALDHIETYTAPVRREKWA